MIQILVNTETIVDDPRFHYDEGDEFERIKIGIRKNVIFFFPWHSK